MVTAFLRQGPDVLLVRRSDAVGTYPGAWGGVSGYAEANPDDQVRVEIREETGFDAADRTFVRAGDPVTIDDTLPDGTRRRWVVHPYLFDVAARDVTPNEELATTTWLPPTAIHDPGRDTVPGLWTAYDRVRPTLETVRDDHDHGSAWLSLRALDVLRDEAALSSDPTEVTAVARALLDARPDMVVLRNRVNRAMADATDAGDWTPDDVATTATETARTAASADTTAAMNAAPLLDGATVATHSRSGTVEDALSRADPDGVVLSEARPGREGVTVAESFASAGLDVTITSDANLPTAATGCDLVLVGADAVTPAGALVNKVGTRSLARCATDADRPVYVVCAADKVAPGPITPTEQAPPDALYDGAADVEIENPRFDMTPASDLDGIVTEAGLLTADDVRARATVHRQLADWTQHVD